MKLMRFALLGAAVAGAYITSFIIKKVTQCWMTLPILQTIL